ncbi:MAG: FUSC family protein, partial [Acetobacteraceae bacterium]|nr:FUSC family protein [Acetobacteraceae bacterium]
MSGTALRRHPPPLQSDTLKRALHAAGPPLLFGLRMWASVCLALYIAFWLELDNPSWAGTTAAIVCQPSIGASLRKGWFRLIGTFIGAVAIVVMTACFPQDRDGFLISLALWGAGCAFVATILRNFAAYAAALAGYTAAIIASDQLGATGGLNGDAFMLAVYRSSEIALGIVCAGVVIGLTGFGGARHRLAAQFAELAAGITAHFTRTLALAGPKLPDTRPLRRDFIGRVAALDPVIDETLGESSRIRYHSPVLQKALDGFFTALAGWRAVANRLVRLPAEEAQQEAATVLQTLPPELTRAEQDRWMADPTGLCRICEAGVHALVALPAHTPSLR